MPNQKTLTLSGWGQAHDALESVAPGALHIEYAAHETVESALAHIADTGRGYDTVIGWSLGGQLAVRAIAQGLIAPKKLVLIAPPFQFVQMQTGALGMPRDTFNTFMHNFMHHPLRTLRKAWELVPMHDAHAAMIRSQLDAFSKEAVLTGHWLSWLNLIDGFSCETLDFKGFPPTLLVHGEEDVVVDVAQSRRFAERIPGARLVTWPGCGHAPHWHDTEGLVRLIAEHSGV